MNVVVEISLSFYVTLLLFAKSTWKLQGALVTWICTNVHQPTNWMIQLFLWTGPFYSGCTLQYEDHVACCQSKSTCCCLHSEAFFFLRDVLTISTHCINLQKVLIRKLKLCLITVALTLWPMLKKTIICWCTRKIALYMYIYFLYNYYKNS